MIFILTVRTQNTHVLNVEEKNKTKKTKKEKQTNVPVIDLTLVP